MSDSVTYEYDTAGRLKKLVFEDDTTVEYQLNVSGSRELVTTVIPSPIARKQTAIKNNQITKESTK